MSAEIKEATEKLISMAIGFMMDNVSLVELEYYKQELYSAIERECEKK